MPLPSPLLPFQCLRLTAKILFRRLRCQEDLSLKILTRLRRGPQGDPGRRGVPAKPPPPPILIPPPWISTSLGGVWFLALQSRLVSCRGAAIFIAFVVFRCYRRQYD